jgi:hypothetical protein
MNFPEPNTPLRTNEPLPTSLDIGRDNYVTALAAAILDILYYMSELDITATESEEIFVKGLIYKIIISKQE